MARTSPELSPIAGRPLTAILGESVSDENQFKSMLMEHLASAPWERLERAFTTTGVPSHDDLVEMVVMVGLPMTLNSYLIQAATDRATGEAATRALCGYAITGQPPGQRFQDIISGEVARPTRRRLDRARLLTHMMMKVEETSGVYAAGGWLCWAMGAPRTAKGYLKRAGRYNPNHQLAGDIMFAIRSKQSPGWPRPR